MYKESIVKQLIKLVSLFSLIVASATLTAKTATNDQAHILKVSYHESYVKVEFDQIINDNAAVCSAQDTTAKQKTAIIHNADSAKMSRMIAAANAALLSGKRVRAYTDQNGCYAQSARITSIHIYSN